MSCLNVEYFYYWYYIFYGRLILFHDHISFRLITTLKKKPSLNNVLISFKKDTVFTAYDNSICKMILGTRDAPKHTGFRFAQKAQLQGSDIAVSEFMLSAE